MNLCMPFALISLRIQSRCALPIPRMLNEKYHSWPVIFLFYAIYIDE